MRRLMDQSKCEVYEVHEGSGEVITHWKVQQELKK